MPDFEMGMSSYDTDRLIIQFILHLHAFFLKKKLRTSDEIRDPTVEVAGAILEIVMKLLSQSLFITILL